MANIIPENNKKGFTLIELVVVIAILAILAAIAIPIVSSLLNTAAKNTSLANAQTIELAIKECKAYIAADNDEVYNGESVRGMVIPKASVEHSSITIEHVAHVKAIDDAFKAVLYDGNTYLPYWDTLKENCIFIGSVNQGGTSEYEDIQGNVIEDTIGISFGSRYVALSIEINDELIINSDLKVDRL